MDKYIWLIPILPLAGFLINGLGRNIFSKGIIGTIGSLMVLISFGLSIAAFLQVKETGKFEVLYQIKIDFSLKTSNASFEIFRWFALHTKQQQKKKLVC